MKRQSEISMQYGWRKYGGNGEKASRGAYYMAVTLLWSSSEQERLSTHYSSDLGGQLEESNINQSVARAEADDSKQQCSKQPPSPKAINTTTSSPSSPLHIQIQLPPYLCAVLLCPLSITLSVVFLLILFISGHCPPPPSTFMPYSLSGSPATNSELTHCHPVLMDF